MSTPVVLLTGGGSGIGLSTTEILLAEHHAQVVVLTLVNTLELQALQTKFGESRLVIIEGDATIEEIVGDAVAKVIETFSYLSTVIHSIGTLQPVEVIRDLSLAGQRKTFEVNYFSALTIAQYSIPHLLRSGARGDLKPSIAIVASAVDTEVIRRGWSGYCCSKAALSRLVPCLAHEEPLIRTVGIYPGITTSPINDAILGGAYNDVMLPEEIDIYVQLEKKKAFDPPKWPAAAVVRAALGLTEKELNGKLLWWNQI